MGVITLTQNELSNIITHAVRDGIELYKANEAANAWITLPHLVSRQEAAEAMNVSVKTIDRLCDTGELRKKKIGATVRIQKTSILKYLNIRL